MNGPVMTELKVKVAQRTLVEALDNAAVAKGGDKVLEGLRDVVARYDYHHPLFRLLALNGFGGVEEFIYSFTPEYLALTTSEQFTNQLMNLLE